MLRNFARGVHGNLRQHHHGHSGTLSARPPSFLHGSVKVNLGRCAVGCQEIGAVESNTSLLVDQIWSEPSGEGALYEEDIFAVESGGCHLSVDGCVDAGGVSYLAFWNMSC